jgi:predicted nucleic acid-binding protein
VILVDSSVWIDLLRKKQTRQTQRPRDVLPTHQAASAPVIYQEILQGASSPENFARLCEYFSRLPFILPLDPVGTYGNAGKLYARCRRSGITPRSPHDCLIACLAIEQGIPLLHDDRDFEAIARVESGLRFEPIEEKF